MLARTPQWLRLVGIAVLGGLIATALLLGMAWVFYVPGRFPIPTTPIPTAQSVQSVVIVLPTPTVGPTAPPAKPGDPAAEIATLRSMLDEQGGLMLISRAERHTALAADSLASNDFAVADRELVAARGALDGAFVLVPEDLKQVIDGERREVARIRSELQIDPEGMDERLRATQDLLLGLIVPPSQ